MKGGNPLGAVLDATKRVRAVYCLSTITPTTLEIDR